jgi:hypothetical protein
VKANRPCDSILGSYSDRLKQPPTGPSKPGHTCNSIKDQLQGFIDMLDTLADDEISASQLNMAGFKDMRRLLQVPC